MSKISRRELNKAVLGTTGAALLRGLPLDGEWQDTPALEPLTGSITDVPGIRVGHYTDPRRPTGVTVLLFDEKGASFRRFGESCFPAGVHSDWQACRVQYATSKNRR